MVSGRVRICKISPGGREQVLLVASAGEIFNEVPVFDGRPNPATAEALEATTVYLLPQQDVLSLAAEYPAIGLAVMRVLAYHLRHLRMLIEGFSFRNVTSRAARILLKWGEEAQEQRVAPLTHRQTAALAGTAREVVGRVI
jgi:CRP/FNR family transcriptional regulator